LMDISRSLFLRFFFFSPRTSRISSRSSPIGLLPPQHWCHSLEIYNLCFSSRTFVSFKHDSGKCKLRTHSNLNGHLYRNKLMFDQIGLKRTSAYLHQFELLRDAISRVDETSARLPELCSRSHRRSVRTEYTYTTT
jgi:hypothetical protein